MLKDRVENRCPLWHPEDRNDFDGCIPGCVRPWWDEMNLRQDLIDFVRNERGGIDRGLLCVELARLGQSCPSVWQKATAERWSQEIDAAVACGQLVMVDRMVAFPKEEAKPKDTQPSLF